MSTLTSSTNKLIVTFLALASSVASVFADGRSMYSPEYGREYGQEGSAKTEILTKTDGYVSTPKAPEMVFFPTDFVAEGNVKQCDF